MAAKVLVKPPQIRLHHRSISLRITALSPIWWLPGKLGVGYGSKVTTLHYFNVTHILRSPWGMELPRWRGRHLTVLDGSKPSIHLF